MRKCFSRHPIARKMSYEIIWRDIMQNSNLFDKANNGDIESQFELGVNYRNGEMVIRKTQTVRSPGLKKRQTAVIRKRLFVWLGFITILAV